MVHIEWLDDFLSSGKSSMIFRYTPWVDGILLVFYWLSSTQISTCRSVEYKLVAWVFWHVTLVGI